MLTVYTILVFFEKIIDLKSAKRKGNTDKGEQEKKEKEELKVGQPRQTSPRHRGRTMRSASGPPGETTGPALPSQAAAAVRHGTPPRGCGTFP